jgi:class 3 adenylate cyclase/tetratricopeptide (TPR) repeat protein
LVALTWDDEAPGALWRIIDGTLVFADVSGFTALTERLSSRGRIGAEEIVETLNRVFGGMVETAAARGADLLKFGGDALLFLFQGDDHAIRACDAAVEMRTALRAAAAVPTSVGRLKLSMSVGIHSGDVNLFLVGAPTRELFILGGAASATANAEATATAGEIVVTEQTAARLPGGSVTPRDDGTLLLRRRKPMQEPWGAVSPATPSRERLASLFPQGLGAYLDPRVPEPEHRVATIGFVRFSGTDALLSGTGPDVVAAAVHRTTSLMERCLAAEGVTLLATDIDLDGGKFFLASGVPQASEDDEGRMLRALRRFVDSGPPLPVQAGASRGHVFAAEVGAPFRAAYSSMGDTTNTAARIMAKAPIGSVYAHPAVLEHSLTLFAASPEGPFPMKGKALPLLVYDVGEEAGTKESGDAARLPFRGRGAELVAVTAVLEGAMAGAGGVVTIVGPTGIGKSRLVHEASDAVPDLRAFVLRAEPYGQASSYRVFRDPLRQLLDVTRGPSDVMGRQVLDALASTAPDLLPMAPLIADVASVEVPSTPEADAIDPQFRPDVLAETLLRLLDRLRPGPLLVVADGGHWIDPASARLLDRMASATSDHPWAVVVIRRGEAGGFLPELGERVVLTALPDPVIERLVIDATESAPLRPHEVSAIVARAEGNPLFVEEVTRVARAVGSLDVMPESLSGAMSVQIDLLAPTARRVLRYASVLGRTFRREVLRETLSSEDLHLDHSTLSQLADFLEADGAHRFRFRTSLLRDAAYEELAYRTRARIHRAAGLATERLSDDLQIDSPTLALHFSRAGDYERAWRYGRMSGEVARRSYANAGAAAQFELALDAARHVEVPREELVQTWSVLADMRQLSGNPEGADAAYRRAAGIVDDDPVLEANLIVMRARVNARAGRSVAALRGTARARRLLGGERGDLAERVRIQSDCLRVLVRLDQSRHAEARRAALVVADGARAMNDPETLVQALMAIDEAEHHLGMPVAGDFTKMALDVCTANGMRFREAIARSNLGTIAYFRGRWDESLDYFQSSKRVANEAGWAIGVAEAEINLADVLVCRGEVDEAERVLKDAIRVERLARRQFWVAFGELQLARVSLVREDYSGAEAQLRPLIERFEAIGARTSALEAALWLAEVLTRAGRFEDALRLVDASVRGAAEHAFPVQARIHLQRAGALLGLGRDDECRAELTAGVAAAREADLLYEEGLLLRMRANLARHQRDACGEAEFDSAAEAVLSGLGIRV